MVIKRAGHNIAEIKQTINSTLVRAAAAW
jgi:hypothetical protein